MLKKREASAGWSKRSRTAADVRGQESGRREEGWERGEWSQHTSYLGGKRTNWRDEVSKTAEPTFSQIPQGPPRHISREQTQTLHV